MISPKKDGVGWAKWLTENKEEVLSLIFDKR